MWEEGPKEEGHASPLSRLGAVWSLRIPWGMHDPEGCV